MALTKRKVLGQVLIDEELNIFVREDIILEEDGVEVARRSHRSSFKPGDDVSGVVGNKVTKIANAIWD